MSVSPVLSPGISQALPGVTAPNGAATTKDNIFSGLLQDADHHQQIADEELQKMVSGESDSLHQVVLSAAKADLSFRLVLEIRNKLMDAYQEVMRMQV